MSRGKKLSEAEIYAILMESSDEEELDECTANIEIFNAKPIRNNISRIELEQREEQDDIQQPENVELPYDLNYNENNLINFVPPAAICVDDQITGHDSSVALDGAVTIDNEILIQVFDFMKADTNITLTDKKDIQWRKKSDYIQIPYEAPIQLEDDSDQVIGEKSPISYFEKYFTDELFQIMASSTNAYAMQNNITFKPTDSNEMKRLIGIHLFIGATKLPQVRIYWDRVIGMDLVLNTMTRDRFFQLRTNLHYVNVLDVPSNNSDIYYKLRPLIITIRSRCLQITLEENLCVDEQMIPFKGRLSAKQYVPNKPKPWGIKMFVLCGKSGQPYDFILYQGANTGLSEYNLKKFGFGPSVVLHLAARIDSKGHKLYFDNYFSSFHLFEILKEIGINAAGTVRINRFFNPQFMDDKKFRKQERGYYEELNSRNTNISIVKWLDNKPVHIASNFTGIGTPGTCLRWEKNKKKYVEVPQPQVIRLYNESMSGVDLLDQLIGYYRVFIKSKKWPLRITTHFLDFACSASWIEYKIDCANRGIPSNKIKSLLEFRFSVANSLMSSQTSQSKKRGRPKNDLNLAATVPSPKRNHVEVRPYVDCRYDCQNHWPLFDGKKESTRCKYEKCTKKSHVMCSKCKVHLCSLKERNCFFDFHNQ